MSTHQYRRADLTADLARGGGGLLMTAGPLLVLPTHWAVAAVLGVAAVVFAIFTVRTLQRRMTVIELDDTGILSRGLPRRAIRWTEISDLKLKYYSTRRDRQNGWMQLTIKGPSGGLAMESTLTGFEDVVERAADAARENGVDLSVATTNNLISIGVLPPPDDLAQRWGVADDEDDGSSDHAERAR